MPMARLTTEEANAASGALWLLHVIVRQNENFGQKLANCLVAVGGQTVSVSCSKSFPNDGHGSVVKPPY